GVDVSLLLTAGIAMGAARKLTRHEHQRRATSAGEGREAAGGLHA
ncbi:MAG: hypothetical protein RLZZ494_1166, partial [Pseudomonadota bacterium]